MIKLTGNQLILKLKEIQEHLPMKYDQANACGYTDYSEFCEAILIAKGVIASIKVCPTCGHKKRYTSSGLTI